MLIPHVEPTVSPRIVPPGLRRWHFIAALTLRDGWTKGAELGLWKGKTTSYLLEYCPALHLIGVDRWAPPGDGSDYDLWDHERYERECREKCAPYGDRLTIIKDWTVKAAKQVPEASLDFVFVDADHTEKGVREDIAAWLPKVKPTGMIMGHDINWDGVRAAVDDLVPGYLIGPDVVWFRPVNPVDGWQKDWE